MRRHLSTILLLACAAGFALGVAQLFKLRFEAGDVYPEYSSLRADPLGAMAFYESLEKLPGLSVRRDHSAANKLPEGRNTVYLHLAARTPEWKWLPEETWKEIDAFLLGGGRLAITFFPEAAVSFRFLDDLELDSDEPAKKKSGDNKETKPAKPGRKDRRTLRKRSGERAFELDSVKKRWGVEFSHVKLSLGDGDTYEPARVANKSALPLPGFLDWHSATVFTNLDETWRTIYARGTNPVVIERRFGAGTVVLASDSYFLSNEALRKDRHPGLLAWLVGANQRVVFDEAHFGIVETSGVAVLIRKYRLHALAAALIVLAGLFIWKNSVSLVPPHGIERAQDYVAGKDTAAGFVNLLRRNIPARDILNVCFEEWSKTMGQGRRVPLSRIEQARAVIAAEKAGAQRDPVAAYKKICERLNHAGSINSSQP